MKYSFFGTLFIALIISSSPTRAGLVSLDLVTGSGDNLITRDKQSGLDWLDVPLTINQTMDQVRTGIWYQNGFRYATRSELEQLFIIAGTADDSSNIANTYPSETRALAQMVGLTLQGPSRESALGFTGTDFFGNSITMTTHPIGVPFSAMLAKIDYLAPAIGEAHFTGGHLSSNQADPNIGSFLVRAVPEPQTYSLILLGLAVMAGRRRFIRPHTLPCTI